jgi:RNA polymerase sigma factor (sigma-70 family)
MHRSDPKLIQSCRRGDQTAWNELVDRYGRLIYSIPRRYGMSDADADDVLQSVFLILIRRLETLRDETRLSSWLITTTHRECWRIGKQSGRGAELDERIADVGSPSEEQLMVWEEQHLVRLALQELGGRCEALLSALFHAGEGIGYETIARRLGIPVGSIGPTRARCFRKLEKILLSLGFTPPVGAGTPAGRR